MADPCRELRESLGAYVLGHLAPEEDAAVAAHLEGCPICAEELPALTETAALLAVADPLREEALGDQLATDEPGRHASAPPDLVERVVARVGADRSRRRRRRLQGLTAAAAAVVVLAVAGVTIPRLLAEPEAPLEQVVLVNDTGAEATATLRPWDWGTGIELEATGLTPGGTYAVWFADDRGRRLSAGTFVAVDDGRVRCRLTSAMLRPAAQTIGVTAVDDGTDVLQTSLE